MQPIVASTCAHGHERAVKYVLEAGVLRATEDGDPTLEAPPLALTVRSPLAAPRSSPCNPVKPLMCEQYARDLLAGTDAVFEYDYHERLFHYGEVPEEGVDQVAAIIEKLRAAPTSRRAVAVTWEPAVDTRTADVPCLQWMKALVWDGRLDLAVVFRSNDICTALGANLVGLTGVQALIAAALGLPVGEYTHVAFSPHVYLARDADYLARFCRESMEGIRPRRELCDGCTGREACGKYRLGVGPRSTK